MSDPFSLEDRAAIVTGGGRGLGRAMAVGLGRAGAAVTVVARREADLDETVGRVEAAGGRALAVAGDVVDPETADRVVAACREAFGRLDVLVNNAGLYDMQPIVSTPAEDWRRVLDVNLMGSFRFAKAVGPHLLAQRSGKVINVASVLGTFGVGSATAYSTAKAGIMGFTRSLAVEWAPHGVQVNAVAPGLFATDMSAGVFEDEDLYRQVVAGIPRGRHGEPEEIVGTVVWLASGASDHVVGQVVHVDGGATVA